MAVSKAGDRRSKSSASDPAALHLADRVWQQAVRVLAAHDRSEQEMRLRLAVLGAPAQDIETTIDRLRDLRYLNDRRLAERTAEQAVRRGHGSEYARAQLTAKGVEERFIDEAIGAAFATEVQLAREVLGRRYPVASQRPAERAKAARFLLQRGFPEAVVLAILGEGC